MKMNTDPTTEIGETTVEMIGDADLVHQLTIQATRPHQLTDDSTLYGAVVPPGWGFATLDLAKCGLGFPPRYKEGGPTLVDIASFADYCNAQAEHAVDNRASFYFQDSGALDGASRGAQTAGSVTAVFDDHDGTQAGHAAHRARLALTFSRSFVELCSHNQGYSSGREFAVWIEDHQELIAAPALAELLDLVRSFKATKFTTIEDRYTEESGDVLLHYQTETQAAGDLIVPEAFTFRVPIFQGQDPIELTGRFRYTVEHGDRPLFGYRLVGLDAAVEAAQTALLGELDEALGGVTIRRGTPPSTR